MSAEEEEKCDCPAGAPGWVMTFADLMSLLLTFFILLLSFAEMDVKKYKKAVGSIQQALGVDADLILENMASSNMALKDTYGKGSDSMREMEFSEPKIAIEVETLCEMEKVRKTREAQELRFRTAQLANKLEKALLPYTNRGLLQLVTADQTITLRFQQDKAFVANSPRLKQLQQEALDVAMPIVKQSNPFIQIQSYSPENYKESKSTLSDWLQSMNRSAYLSFALSKADYPSEKIKVQSYTSKAAREPAAVRKKLPNFIDINMEINYE